MSQSGSLIGTTLGQYQILDELGRGGMSVVYKAWQPSLRRYVALKVLQPHLTNDWEFVQRFQQEAIVAANLRHPNIVTIYEVAQQDRQLFIAMEFVEGRSLEAMIKQEGALTLPRTVALLRQVAAALDYAHERRFVHRDIKPANIMVTPDERVVITDFGIAKAMEGSGATARITQAGSVLGTIEYMAPEQIQGQPPDYRADLYSLGIVAYEMLTGRIPFDSPTTASLLYAQVNLLPPDVRQLAPALPPSVAQALARMLAKSPADRFPSAGAFVEALSGTTPAEAPKAQTAVLPPGYQPPPQPWPATVPMGSAPTMVSPPVTPGVAPYPAPTTAAGKKSKGWLWAGLAAGGLVLCLVMAIGIYLLFFRGPTVAQLIQDGQQALAATQYPEAKEAFAAALEKEPDNPAAHRGLGWVYYDTGDYEQAVAEFTKAVALEPANAEGYRGQGLSYQALKKYEESLEPLKKWSELEPQNEPAQTSLGWSLFNLQRYAEACDSFSQSIQLHESAEAYHGLSMCHYNLSQFEQSLAAAQKWAELNAKDPNAHNIIGWSLYNLQRHEEASQAFSHSTELQPTASAYSGLGNSYLKLGQSESALEAVQKWLELEPDNADAHRLKGWALYNLGKDNEAAAAFSRSLELQETDDAYLGLKNCYFRLRQYEKALESCERWLQIAPNNAEVHLHKGWALYNLQRYDEAIRAFSKSLELQKTPGAYQGLATAYYALGNYEQALSNCRQWVALAPNDPTAHSLIGWSSYNLQQYQDALASFSESIRLKETESAYSGLANTYYALKQYTQAAETASQWIELNPNNSDAFAMAGWAYIGLRNCTEARSNLDKALQLNPQHQWARDGLKQCP